MDQIISYKDFRTGYTWREVSEMVWSHSDDPSNWHPGIAKRTRGKRGKYKGKPVGGRRHTILGLWHQIKQEMYDRYLSEINAVPF